MNNQTKEEFIKVLNNSKITGHIDDRHLIQIEKSSDGARSITLDNFILKQFDNIINEKIERIEKLFTEVEERENRVEVDDVITILKE